MAQSKISVDLWFEAIDSLPLTLVDQLKPARSGVRNVTAALRIANKKYEIAKKKQWIIEKPTGEALIVRDVVEKIVFWISQFKKLGDNATRFDPSHAALPWATVRLLLQAAVREEAVYGDMIEDIELSARVITQFREIESACDSGPPNMLDHVESSLVETYTAVLGLLASVLVSASNKATGKPLDASLQQITEERRKVVLSKEAEVYRHILLAKGCQPRRITTAMVRRSDLSLSSEVEVEEEKYLEIVDWMSDTSRATQKGHSYSRIHGFGEWLTERDDFIDWLTSSVSSQLLLSGPPGCGKTMLCSMIIDHHLVQSTTTPEIPPLARFYCSNSEMEYARRDSGVVLRSLARQLATSKSPVPRVHSAILSRYNELAKDFNEKKSFTSGIKTSDSVDFILAALEDNPAIIVIDAIDELDDPEILVKTLNAIIRKSMNVVKIIMTSTEGKLISSAVPRSLSIPITGKLNKSDTLSFARKVVEDAVSGNEIFTSEKAQVSPEQIVDYLASNARGSFEWIELQLMRLCKPTPEIDLLAALSSNSTSGLDELYRIEYAQIDNGDQKTREIAHRTFSWLLFAREELTSEAILEALSVTEDTTNLTVNDLLNICRGFVRLDGESQILRLSGRTARDFLRLQTSLNTRLAHSRLVEACLVFCSRGRDMNNTELRLAQDIHDYAVLYLGYHCSVAAIQPSEDLFHGLHKFMFGDDRAGPSLSLWLQDAKRVLELLPVGHPQRATMGCLCDQQNSPSFALCTFGLLPLLQHYEWPADFQWDQCNENGYSCLCIAALLGHPDTVSFLLEHGAQVNVECDKYGSPLCCAAFRGHLPVVEKLLHHKADPTLGSVFKSAVHAACDGGHEEVVVAILKCTLESLTYSDFDSYMLIASKAGFVHALGILSRSPWGATLTPKQVTEYGKQVIIGGNITVLEWWLDGESWDHLVPTGSVALSALYGHDDMTTYLLDEKMEVDEEDPEIGHALYCASLRGHNRICRLLLEHGADVNHNGRHGSALHAAAMEGNFHTIKLLLDAGAKPEIEGGKYGNCLQAAAYFGHKEIVASLLAARAYPYASGLYPDAFHAAAEGGQHEIIIALLDRGHTISRRRGLATSAARRAPSPPRNILREACPEHRRNRQYGHRGCGAGVGLPRKQRDHPLEAAASLGHLRTVSMMLNHYDRLGLDDRATKNALLAACRAGQDVVVKEICTWLGEESVPLRDALGAAALQSHEATIRMLLRDIKSAESNHDALEFALRKSIIGGESAFRLTLQVVKEEFSAADVRRLLRDAFDSVAGAEWREETEAEDDPREIDQGPTMSAILNSDPDLSDNELLSGFERACESGDVSVVKAIHERLRSETLEPGTVSRCLGLAVEDSYTDLFQYLFRFCAEILSADDLCNMIFMSAGQGCKTMTQSLLEHYESGYADRQEVIDRALDTGAHTGQNKVCTYLLSRGADPTRAVLPVLWEDISIRDKEKERDDFGASEGQRRDPNKKQNAILSCLDGYHRFNCSEMYQAFRALPWEKWDRAAHDETMRTLIQHAIRRDESMCARTICRAAQFCTPDLLSLILKSGADLDAQFEEQSLIEFAAKRENLSFSIVQCLADAGAGSKWSEKALQKSLNQALSFFKLHHGPAWQQQGLFEETETLDNVFTDGPGALVKYLLHRLPNEVANGDEYAVLLQCAAAAGRLDHVSLLVERNVDVNAAGSYYGTALQAASLFDHLEVMKHLLQAGADPAIIQGVYSTAMRAAVRESQIQAIDLLIANGAQTEMSTPDPERETTPLQLAINLESTNTALALISAGANVHARERNKPPLLIQACKTGNELLAGALLSAGADIHTRDFATPNSDESTPLHAAISKGHMGLCRRLLSDGFNLTADFGPIEAPLNFAARKGKLEAIDFLLDAMAPVSTEKLNDALRSAVNGYQAEATKKLIGAGAVVFDVERDINMLRLGPAKVNSKILEYILEAISAKGSVDLACQDMWNDSAHGNARSFEILLEYTSCAPEMFVEACAGGYETVIRTGLEQGFSADTVDGKQRPALHVAAARGMASTLEILLNSGADPNREDPTYGPVIRTALESFALQNQINARELPEEALTYIEALSALTGIRFSYYPVSHRRRSAEDLEDVKEYEIIIRLLLTHGALAETSPGVLGNALTLAACMGLRSIFDMLLKYGAKVGTGGGWLESPLVAAVRGNHTRLVKDILNWLPGSGTEALFHACAKGNLPAVRMLLQEVPKIVIANDAGETPLQISLKGLGYSNDERETIVNLLLDQYPPNSIVDEDLIHAATVRRLNFRVQIIERMLPLAGSTYFPEEGFVALLEQGSHRVGRRLQRSGNPDTDLVGRMLDERRVRRITTRIVSATRNAATLDLLLDYDLNYKITADSIDAVAGRRDCVQLLIHRADNLITTESNVIKLLENMSHASLGPGNGVEGPRFPHPLDMVFDHNPQLEVTEEMLQIVRRPDDLKILLARTKPEDGLVTPAVLESLPSRKHAPADLVWAFIEFDPSLSISPGTAEHYISNVGVSGLERMWSHDSQYRVPDDLLFRLISVNLRPYWTKKDEHRNLVELLRKYRGQWVFSLKLKHNIDTLFWEQQGQELRSLYHSLGEG